MLTSLGPIVAYPPRLKHLDASCNKICTIHFASASITKSFSAIWFTSAQHMEDILCHLQSSDQALVSALGQAPATTTEASRESRSPTSSHRSAAARRRSQSSARTHRAHSVVRCSDSLHSSPIGTVTACVHRRHNRLDNLRTLIVCNNRLDHIGIHSSTRSENASQDRRARKASESGKISS